MTYVSFIIRRNGTKIRRIAGVKTADEALQKFATLTRNDVNVLKEKGYTAEEVPAETQAEIGARMDARHAKWFHGRSGASKVADRLVRQAQRRGESTPADLVNHLLEDDKPIVLRHKKPASKKNAVYIRVASPEGYEAEGAPSYYGPFDSVASAEETIRKYPAFERVDSGSYDYDDGQTQLTLNVMLALPTGVTAKLPTDFDGEWAWTLQEDCNKFIVKGWKEGKVGGYDSVEAAIEDYKAWSGGQTPDEDGFAVIPC